MFSYATYLVLTAFLKLVTSTERPPTLVQSAFGEVEGFEYITENNVPVHVFLGIRYGEAPDVFKRFEKPEMVEKWMVRHHATHFRARCIPYHERALTEHDNFSEDCLFLNIVTPTKQATAALPVLVLIHGGGFQTGSSVDIGYERIANQVSSQGIVVVTLQYRLGPFGFFSLGDADAPGNLGLWDITLALHFLHETISMFGGDPMRITLGGHSSGACAASALQYSPHSQALFSQSLAMSGSVFSEISLSNAVVQESWRLAEELKCARKKGEDGMFKSTRDIMDCMKQQTAHDIIKAVDKIGSTRRHPNILKFHPRIDGDFLPSSVEKLARTASKKRTLSGITDTESALFVMHPVTELLSGLLVKQADWSFFSRQNLTDFINEIVVTESEHGAHSATFRQLLTDFYVDRGAPMTSFAHNFYLERFAELASDLQFVIPAYHELEIKRMNGWPTWFYVMDYASETARGEDFPIKGALHADELRFLFELDWQTPIKGEKDDAFKRIFTDIIVNFVKRGDPSISGFAWPAVSASLPFVHARLRPTPVIEKTPFRPEAAALWLRRLPREVDMDSLGHRLPAASAHARHMEL